MTKTTLKQIAKACRVSVNTASLAMRDSKRLPENTRSRIQNTAKEMHYIPNRIARALIGGSTQTIGLLMHTLADSGHLQFFNAVEKSIKTAGYSLLVETIKGNNDEVAINQLLSAGIDGLIVNSCSQLTINKLFETNFKNICLAGKELVPNAYCDQIYFSEYEGCKILMQHFIDIGHKRIGFITASKSEKDPRTAAYLDSLKQAGLTLDKNLTAFIPYGEFSIESIDIARSKLMGMKERPTAIFAYHDEVALKLMHSLQKAGFKIPDDIAVAGINNTWAGEFSLIPLTSLDFKLDLHGKLSAKAIIKRIKNQEAPLVTEKLIPQLHMRESTFLDS